MLSDKLLQETQSYQFPLPILLINIPGELNSYEDFIPFAEVMPYADVYITNGGYGGTLLAIENGLPMIVAGVHEGKNEICARVGYFKLGINLKTERPLSRQLAYSVEAIFADPAYKQNVLSLAEEFGQYRAGELTASFVEKLTEQSTVPVHQEADELLF